MAQVATVPGQERMNRWVAIGAVVFAALAAVLLFVALQSRDGGGGSAASTVDVVVASQDISANTTLTEDMLAVEAIPSDSLLDGAYAELEPVIGLPLRIPLQAGEQVTSAKLGTAAIANEDDVSLLLKPGQRAFAVEAAEVSAVGGLLLAGNTVDVIAVFRGDEAGTQHSYTVLQNLTVLSVAQMAQEPVPAAAPAEDGTEQTTDGVTGQRPDDIERQPDASSVTLAVTPEQAQFLAALQDDENATVWLTLRPAGDTDSPQIPATNLFPYEPVPTLEPLPTG